MSEQEVVFIIIGLILGGGGIGALTPLLKLKQDKESFIASGSEIAVKSLISALNVANNRVTELEKEVVGLEQENDELKALISSLQTESLISSTKITELKKELFEVKRLLAKVLEKDE